MLCDITKTIYSKKSVGYSISPVIIVLSPSTRYMVHLFLPEQLVIRGYDSRDRDP